MPPPTARPNDTIPEIRTKLDGGLNTRDNPYQVRPDQVIELQNFRGDEGGSLHLRDCATRRATIDYPSAVGSIASFRLPAPVISAIGGTVPAGSYIVKLFYVRWGGPAVPGTPDIGATFNSNTLVLGAPGGLRVVLAPENLGEGVADGLGTPQRPFDDPFMGGLSLSQVYVYVQKDAGNWEFQGVKAFVHQSGVTQVYQLDLATYVTGLGSNPADVVNSQPIRKLYYYATPRVLVAIANNRAFVQELFTSFTTMAAVGLPVDKNNSRYAAFSHQPIPIDMCTVGRVVVGADGLRPKKLSYGSQATNHFLMLGANPPSAAPTVAVGAAGALTGTYFYRMTFIYRHFRMTGKKLNEFWYSESRPVTSGSVAPAAQRVTVTIGALQSETNLFAVRLYRTTAGGSTFFRLTDITSLPTASFSDNIADSALGLKTDPDDTGKVPLDLPPNSLKYVIQFRQRCFGVVGRRDQMEASNDTRVITITGSNQVRVSKIQAETYSQSPTGTDVDDIESTVDHWPNDVDHTIACGDDEPITALVRFHGQIYVFKDGEVGFIDGRNPGEYSYEELYSDLGAMSQSVLDVVGMLYFWNVEKGAYSFDGRAFTWIGYEIQPLWEVDRAAGYYCYNVVHDRQVNEIRWSFTNASLNPSTGQLDSTQSNLAAVRGTWKEYVYNSETKSWWFFNGANNGRDVRAVVNAWTRGVLESVSARKSVYLGSTLGTISEEHQGAVQDPTLSSTTPVTAFATLRFAGLGEDLDWVKLFKLVFIAYTMGTPTTGSVTIKARYQQTDSWTTLGTLVATTVGTMVRAFDIPDKLADNVSKDRGLQIRVESTVDCELSFQAFCARYKGLTHDQKTVRPT